MPELSESDMQQTPTAPPDDDPPPRDDEADELEARRAAQREAHNRGGSHALPPVATIELLAFTPEQILADIEPEIELLPGIPSDAYTLMPGALSTYKTTLLLYLLVWKATGWDVLGLDDRGNGITIGKSVLVTYEDSDARLFKKLQRVVQHGYQVIARRWTERDAREFVARAARNVSRITCSGRVERGLVHRVAGIIEPNYAFLAPLTERLRKLAPEGALIGLDPLRLAIVGSQNNDDGADVVVHTLNNLASAVPGSGLIVSSHTTKSIATIAATLESNGFAEAAYATSGSALYSQHARSNFFLQRLTEQDARSLFDPKEVTAEDVKKQRVVRLAHGRLSHGDERDTVYLLMRAGTLQRVGPRPSRTAADVIREEAPHVLAAIDRLREQSVCVSKQALESDTGLARALAGTRARVRAALKLLEENGYIEWSGKTTNRSAAITAKGRELVPAPQTTRAENGESRRE